MPLPRGQYGVSAVRVRASLRRQKREGSRRASESYLVIDLLRPLHLLQDTVRLCAVGRCVASALWVVLLPQRGARCTAHGRDWSGPRIVLLAVQALMWDR